MRLICLFIALIASVACSEEPVKEPKIFTLEELKNYNGKDETKPIYFAVIGDVFDVSSAKDFYGKNAPYSAYAGEDITRAIAIWTKDAKEIARGMDLRELNYDKIINLNKVYKKFAKKYPIVGMMLYKKIQLDKAAKEAAEEEAAEAKLAKEREEEVVEEILAEVDAGEKLEKIIYNDEEPIEEADKEETDRTTSRSVTSTEL